MPDLFLPVVIPFAFAVFRAITFFHGCLHLPENKRNSALLLQDAEMVEVKRFELSPYRLKAGCSATELHFHKIRRRSA